MKRDPMPVSIIEPSGGGEFPISSSRCGSKRDYGHGGLIGTWVLDHQ